MGSKNGKQIGQEHLATFEEYLLHGGQLPVAREGSLNLSELVRVTGIPKSSFYQNPKIEARLEEARHQQGLARAGERRRVDGDSPEGSSAEKPLAARATAQLERKLHRLEQQNAVLVAENSELRRQVKHLQLQLGREDMLIDSGRRIPAPAERS